MPLTGVAGLLVRGCYQVSDVDSCIMKCGHVHALLFLCAAYLTGAGPQGSALLAVLYVCNWCSRPEQAIQ